MSWNQYEKMVLAHFPRGTKVKPTHGGGVEIAVPCKHHGCSPPPQPFKMHMPGDAAKKVFANKGWRFWGAKTTCPEHSRKDDQPMPNSPRLDPTKIANASDIALTAGTLPQAVASVQAREAKRMVLLLLDEQFDAAKGAYKNGYSDLKVSKELGLSEETVSNLREEFFGPIREPAEITEFREKAVAFGERIDAVEREVQASHAAATEILKGMRDDWTKMTGRLAALVNRNGW
jgi:hypothetical protein